jgi:hypothetical protein
VLCTTD